MPHLPALGFPPNSAFSSRDLIKLPDIVPSNLIVNLGRIIMTGLFAAASSPITGVRSTRSSRVPARLLKATPSKPGSHDAADRGRARPPRAPGTRARDAAMAGPTQERIADLGSGSRSLARANEISDDAPRPALTPVNKSHCAES